MMTSNYNNYYNIINNKYHSMTTKNKISLGTLLSAVHSTLATSVCVSLQINIGWDTYIE